MRRKRKPDLLAVLAIVVGLGVIATGLAQGMLAPEDSDTYLASNQARSSLSAMPAGKPAIRRP